MLRGTFARVHEQLQGGRHGVSSFGGADAAAIRDTYDLDSNGSFETVFDAPARTRRSRACSSIRGMSQPIIDEFILGYRRQFPGQVERRRGGHQPQGPQHVRADGYQRPIYPDGPNQPFGGFGLVDPNQGIVYRLTNSDWNAMHYQRAADDGRQEPVAQLPVDGRDPSAVAARQRARGTRPIRRASSSPMRFPTTGCCGGRATRNDHNSYPGNTTAPMWNPFSYRFNGTWHAPYGIVVGGQLFGGLGRLELVDRRSAARQQPGARGVRARDGGVVDRIGASRIRCERASASSIRRAAKGRCCWRRRTRSASSSASGFRLGGNRDVEVATNILNLLNAGRGTEYARGGANRRYNTVAYLQPGNLQAARSFQLDILFRF